MSDANPFLSPQHDEIEERSPVGLLEFCVLAWRRRLSPNRMALRMKSWEVNATIFLIAVVPCVAFALVKVVRAPISVMLLYLASVTFCWLANWSTAWLLVKIGQRFGGSATVSRMRAALMKACLPGIVTAVSTGGAIAAFNIYMSYNRGRLDAFSTNLIFFAILFVLNVVLGIWSILMTWFGVAEAHRFRSLVTAIPTMLLAFGCLPHLMMASPLLGCMLVWQLIEWTYDCWFN